MNDKDFVKLLLSSFSCFNPIDQMHCNKCPACFRRNVILHKYKNLDLRIANHVFGFNNPALVNEYAGKLDTYNKDRQECTESYIQHLTK